MIKILDVLRVGDRLSTEDEGTIRASLPGLEIGIRSVPANRHGGDFHGAVYLQDGRTALFVGDIAGHDFSAGIVAAAVIEYIENNQDALLTPNLFLDKMARNLYHTLTQNGRFFTFATCVINSENGTLSYASAGHPPALFYSAIRDRVDPVGKKSFPVGFEKEVDFFLVRREFAPGDVLLLYTDGIVGARNEKKEEFGVERLEKALRETHGESPDRIIGRVIDDIAAFAYDESHRDDQTLLVASHV